MAFNKVILIGNMCADPELKQTQGGISVTSFSIAVNRKTKDEVDFITIQAWRGQAEFVCKYFKKGNPILICGSLQTRTWSDSNGNKRYATEVVADEISFVGSKESPTEAKNTPSARVSLPGAYTQPKFEEMPSEGLPF